MQTPGARIVDISQSDYGALSKKPTSLRALRVPGFADVMNAWRLANASGPSMKLGGWDSAKQGRKTAQAKEYPSHLSRALAFVLTDGP